MIYTYHYCAFTQVKPGEMRHSSGVLQVPNRIDSPAGFDAAQAEIAAHMDVADKSRVIVVTLNLLTKV